MAGTMESYDFEADSAVFDALRKAFAGDLPLKGEGVPGAAPLFLVGLPWTGIGLAERILSAHPAVVSSRSCPAMAAAVRAMAGGAASDALDVTAITALTGKSAVALGQAYLAEAGEAEGRFIDSFPLNFLYIGWILQALPYASVVCLRRGAMDSVWGNFRHATDEHGWARDLMHGARYVLLFQRLMAFWRQRFPGRIHEVTYEFLLADPEVQSRRMLAFCGLDWDAACAANFAASPDDGAISAWRSYESHLHEVMEFFTENGIPLD